MHLLFFNKTLTLNTNRPLGFVQLVGYGMTVNKPHLVSGGREAAWRPLEERK